MSKESTANWRGIAGSRSSRTGWDEGIDGVERLPENPVTEIYARDPRHHVHQPELAGCRVLLKIRRKKKADGVR